MRKCMYVSLLSMCLYCIVQMVIDHLMRDSVVLSVHDVKTILIGPDLARFKAEIHFSPMQIVNKYLSAHDNLAEVLQNI